MSRKKMFVLLAMILGLLSNQAQAQLPETTPEHALLKKDVGTWKAIVKVYMGPDGQTDPTAEPSVSEGQEVNRMLGNFWVVGEFKGEFAGMAFEGHSMNGYDPKLQKYVGSWIDSVSPYAMHSHGKYDPKTKTLTSETKGVGMDGSESKGKSILVYTDDDHRSMTMYEMKDGKELKSMEVEYVRQK